jgi:hypothetical protein
MKRNFKMNFGGMQFIFRRVLIRYAQFIPIAVAHHQMKALIFHRKSIQKGDNQGRRVDRMGSSAPHGDQNHIPPPPRAQAAQEYGDRTTVAIFSSSANAPAKVDLFS